MSVQSIQRRRRRDSAKIKMKGPTLRNEQSHNEFLSRITKTLYYGRFPKTDKLSLPVSEFAAELYSEVKSGRSLDRLRLEDVAEISRNVCVSPCSLVLAILYLERLKLCNPEFLDITTTADMFLVSTMIATKFLSDDGEEDEVYNSEWAYSYGIPVKDLNKLEGRFLKAINWEVYVPDEQFWVNLENLEISLALREGNRRGWFSYTELELLLNYVDTLNIVHTMILVSAVCFTAYAASILTMVGSTMIAMKISPLTQLSVTTYVHPRNYSAGLITLSEYQTFNETNLERNEQNWSLNWLTDLNEAIFDYNVRNDKKALSNLLDLNSMTYLTEYLLKSFSSFPNIQFVITS